MNFIAARQFVYNRGRAPTTFLNEMVRWVTLAPKGLFERNEFADIYSRVKVELGAYENLLHRKAVMLEVLRVLALFESGCNWTEGEDETRRGADTNENKEAGAWQQSYNCRKLSSDVQTVLLNAAITNGTQFQQAMKRDHELALLVTTMLLRTDLSNFEKIPNGPLRKGDEREKTWPDRPKLWSSEESIYPHLSREAVDEFRKALVE